VNTIVKNVIVKMQTIYMSPLWKTDQSQPILSSIFQLS